MKHNRQKAQDNSSKSVKAPILPPNNSKGAKYDKRYCNLPHVRQELDDREKAEQEFIKKFGKPILREKCHSKKDNL